MVEGIEEEFVMESFLRAWMTSPGDRNASAGDLAPSDKCGLASRRQVPAKLVKLSGSSRSQPRHSTTIRLEPRKYPATSTLSGPHIEKRQRCREVPPHSPYSAAISSALSRSIPRNTEYPANSIAPQGKASRERPTSTTLWLPAVLCYIQLLYSLINLC